MNRDEATEPLTADTKSVEMTTQITAVNPFSHQFLIQSPDGTLCVGIDCVKVEQAERERREREAEAEREAARAATLRQAQALLTHWTGGDAATRPSMGDAAHVDPVAHRTRIRMFKIAFSMLILIDIVVGNVSQWGIPGEGSLAWYIMVIDVVILDMLGLFAAYREDANLLQVFVLWDLIGIAFALFPVLFVFILFRLLLLYAAMALRFLILTGADIEGEGPEEPTANEAPDPGPTPPAAEPVPGAEAADSESSELDSD